MDDEQKGGAAAAKAHEGLREARLWMRKAGGKDGYAQQKRTEADVDFGVEPCFQTQEQRAGEDEPFGMRDARVLYGDPVAQQEEGQAGQKPVARVVPRRGGKFVEHNAG